MTGGSAVSGRPHLLLVDDQPANVRVLAEALRDEYDLLFATSGEKALEIVGAGGVELVLLDVMMPDLDGFEVCRRMRRDERTSGIPVIFVTAREETHDEALGFDVGAVDYITKPIHPSVVRARVRTHLELKHARDLLEDLALLDALTGIANRRRFDACLETEWKRALRSGSPLSLAMIDVDHFKRFNDTYGHARGDECLRAIAQSLRSVARRPADLAARYGGEEFALILPDTDERAAPALLRDALLGIDELAIPHMNPAGGERVSVSGGAVTVRPAPGQEGLKSVETADRLLYQAKEQGRNRVVHLDIATGTQRVIRTTRQPGESRAPEESPS